MLRFAMIAALAVSFISGCQRTAVQPVEIVHTGSGYQLMRGGYPFEIRGAGANAYYGRLAEYGGNSIRTWGEDQWEDAFKEADKYGLTVCAGVWLEQERQGFDYSDADTVRQQFEKIRKSILKYKDHPALLMWGIGNELDLNYKNPAVWDAVEEIAKFIHEADGKHPVMTATAFIEKEEVDFLNARCPHIDLLCVNAYAGLPVLSQLLKEFGWEKPYIVGEWGPMGHWEMPQTPWHEPIEMTSTQKADLIFRHYQHLLSDPNCLGGYVFLWGQKQERTATWYSMFLENGSKTEAVDAMRKCWLGDYPENRAPFIDSLRIDGRIPADPVMLSAGSRHEAFVFAGDPDSDALTAVWEIMPENAEKGVGGDEEIKPETKPELLDAEQGMQQQFRAPHDPGAYRLYVTLYDGQGSGAHANIPFYVHE